MPLVPQNIKQLVPYKAGRPIDEVARELGLSKIVKLASNENPFGPSPLAVRAAQDSLPAVHRYPDPAAFALQSELASRFSVKIENVITGSGSESIMAAITRTFLLPSDEILSAEGTFVGFYVLANASGRRSRWIPMKNHRYDLQAMADAINEYTKLIYVANPDNPTGTYATVTEFDAFMARVPRDVLVVLDEAYFEFANRQPNYPDSMHYRYDNVITLRTFSKAHGLAGLRVGYGLAHEEIIENLRKTRLPFEPSVPAQAAALAALRDDAHLQRTIQNNRQELARLVAAFKLWGVEAIPSAANFFSLEFGNEARAVAFTNGLLQRGVIVRHLTWFGWPTMVRVTVGTPEENEFLLEQAESTFSAI